MELKKIKGKILKTLLEMEKKDKFSPELPFREAVKRQYNISRSLDEYLNKFPTLIDYLRPNSKFLEIGAGEGIAFNTIINKYGLNGQGTNIEKLIDQPFIHAFASDLPFNDNTFDLVISVQSITWEPDQRKAIGEIVRVLKPQGRAFINLAKFSEITLLWFGETFWETFSINDFKSKYDFDENENRSCEICVKKLKNEEDSWPDNYVLTITKNKI